MSLAVLGWLAPRPADAVEPEPLWMKLTSEVPGNLFVEGEPVAMKLTVVGGDKDPATGTWADLRLAYRVDEVDGDWTRRKDLGTFTAADARDIAFEVELPGRGLYRLTVEGEAATGITGSKEVPLGMVFEPDPPSPDSRWGVFLIPYGGAEATPEQAEALAENMRRLGVSWVRLNFWANAFHDVEVISTDPPVVRAAYPTWKAMAQALQRRGLSIMGTICHVPDELSSQPGVIGPRASDAGPQWARVMPRDPRLWEAFLADMASQFREEITYWETWNEPNLPRRYWAGSLEQFHRLVPHTVAGLKKGNPDARIVFSGFSSSDHENENPVPVADAALGAGIAELVDVFSAHNMDQQEHITAQWAGVLARHGLADVPIWDTEPKNLLPLRGYEMGVEKTFHFLHIAPAGNYGAFDALVRSDLTPLASGLTFSTAAKLIGTRPVTRAFKAPTFDVYVFADAERTTIVYRPTMQGLLPGRAVIKAPQGSRDSLAWYDHLGRSRPIDLADGRFTVPLEGMGFVTAQGPLQVEAFEAPQVKPGPIQQVFAFHDAEVTGPWDANRTATGWMNDRILAIFSVEDPGETPYGAKLTLDVPRDGTYEIYISSDIWTRLERPRSISSWRWRLDAGDWQDFEGPLPMLWREHGPRNEANTLVREDEVFFLGGHHVLQRLGTFPLAGGEHTFAFELTGRRETPDQAYCIYFDAVVLRPGNEGE